MKFTKIATAVGQARGKGVRGLMGISGKMFSIYHVFSLVKITLNPNLRTRVFLVIIHFP